MKKEYDHSQSASHAREMDWQSRHQTLFIPKEGRENIDKTPKRTTKVWSS